MESWVWSIILLVVAILIVCAEMFIPSGGMLGILSAIAIFGSLTLAFMSSFQFGMIMLITTCILVPIVIMSALQWWPNTPIGRLIMIHPPENEADVLPDQDVEHHLRSLIGKRGVALSVMMPSGLIEIDGEQFDAFSNGMPVEAGQPIEVVAVKMRRLEVRIVEKDEPPPLQNPVANPDDILSKPIESFGLEGLDDPLT